MGAIHRRPADDAGDNEIRIEVESIGRLDEHARVPISFRVESVFDVGLVDGGVGGVSLTERQLEDPWVKDYDAIDGARPTDWPRRFDVERWGLLAAFREGRRLGGAVVAFDTAGLDLLDGSDDLAVLWDIRVQPDARGARVGTALFEAVRTWALARGCRALKIETQNVNVPACHFYRRMGCTLASVDRAAYPELPDEVQLIWQTTI